MNGEDFLVSDSTAAPPPSPLLAPPGIGIGTEKPVQTDPAKQLISQMGTGEKILSAIGEFGAAFRGQPSPLNERVRLQLQDRLQKAQAFRVHTDALEDGVKMAARLRGEGRIKFINQYAKQLDEAMPGLGDTYKTISDQPDMGKVLAKYADKSPTLQRSLDLDPTGQTAIKLLASPEANKTVNAEIDSSVMPLLLRKGQTFKMGWQQLVPPEMADRFNKDGQISASEFLEANEWIKKNRPEMKALTLSDEDLAIVGRNQDAYYGTLGIVAPKGEQDIMKKHAEDKGSRVLTEVGVAGGKFQKAYVENGKVTEYVGEPYKKSEGVNLNFAPQPALDTDPNSPTYGQPVLITTPKSGGKPSILPGVAPKPKELTPSQQLIADILNNPEGKGAKQKQVPVLPAAIVSKLKVGVNTTLSDGSVWTLENGKPKKVK